MILNNEENIPIHILANIISNYILINTGKIIQINLPLQTDKEKELFIKAINFIEINGMYFNKKR